MKLWPTGAVAGALIAALTFSAGWSASTAAREPDTTLDRFLGTIQAIPQTGRVCVLPVDEDDLERMGEVCALYAQESDIELLVGERVLVEWIAWAGSEDESAFDVLHLTSP
ncbi:MAG: hypothetical protein Q8Q44_26260 [Nocardioides sp.]|nr:hypothetical protein [Nocardioides sp.]